MIGRLVALIWIAEMAVPTVAVTVGDACSDGVLVTTGTAFGLIRIVTEAELPWPIRFDAFSTTGKSPLWLGVPEITPVFGSALRPAGSPVAR